MAHNNSLTSSSSNLDAEPNPQLTPFNVVSLDFDVDDDNVEEELVDYFNWLEIKAHPFNYYTDSNPVTLNSINSVKNVGDFSSLCSVEIPNFVCSVDRSSAMLVSISLSKFDESAVDSFIDSHALLDSGASANLISEAFVLASKIPVVQKHSPYKVVLANKKISAVISFETVPVWLFLGDHKEQISLDVMPSLSYPLIIGLPWLEKHNPVVNWRNRSLQFLNCSCCRVETKCVSIVEFCLPVELDCASLIHFGEGLEDDEIYDDTPSNSSEDFSSLPEVYLDFKDVFSAAGADILPEHRKYDCEITLKSPDSVPPFRPIYSLPEADRIELRKYITDMKAKGFIRESSSPAGAGVFFVPKKDKTKRLCVDYRWLNELTIRNSFPLPLINDLIDRLRFASIFTKIDLRGAYNLVRIKPGDEWKTAFRCVFGHFEYTVMPFGLTNAPAVFQSMMTDIFRDILDVYVIVYIDDLLIFSASVEDHVNHVREVLNRLRTHQLFAKLTKCTFHSKSVEFLGFVISDSGIHMAEDKISSIHSWPVPSKVRDIQSFLGFVNFYRKFIRSFSTLAAPLTELTKKDVPWLWSSVQQDAFIALKSAVSSAPCLSHPKFDRPFYLETDASKFAVGAVLSQSSSSDPSPDLSPVGFFSRKMSSAECNYDVHDKELLAIVCALDHWSHYFLGAPHSLQIFTDHRNLVYFRTRQTLSPRLLRWSMFLNQFDFVLSYRRGSENIPADLLSRRSDFVEEGCESLTASELQSQVLLPDHFWNDTNIHIASINSATRQLTSVLDESEQINIIIQRHNSLFAGHPGRAKTFALISRDFVWPKMREMIYKYVDSCVVCQQTKTRRQKPLGLLKPLPISSRPWKDISMDFITKLPLSLNFDSILVVVDRFSKMTHFIPCVEALNAEALSHLIINNIIRLHGLPDSIVSDRGPQFVSSFWKTLLGLLDIKVSLASAAHPQTDGQTERMNQNLEQYLRCFVNYFQDDWSSLLPYAEFAINNVPNVSTGKSPFEINFGFNPRMDYLNNADDSKIESVDTWVDNLKLIHIGIESALHQSSEKMIFYANKKRLDHKFVVGDYVWLSTENLSVKRPSRKLDVRRVGPFKIIKFINDVSVRLELPANIRIHPVFHVNLLTPFKQPQQGQEIHRPTAIDINGAEEFEVELILNVRRRKGILEFLVKWIGYDAIENSWEPLDNVVNAWDLVTKFYKSQPNALRPSRKEISSFNLDLEGM